MHIYDKEMEMYEKILPKMQSLLQQLHDKKKMFAKTIYVNNLNKAVVLEDLSLKGYSVRTGKDGYDIYHIKMILSKLAKFHGMSAVLQKQYPDIFQNFKHGRKNQFVVICH